MSDWRPSSGPDAARRRAALTGRVRAYFEREGVLEVDTPALSRGAVSDTQIESFGIAPSVVSPQPLYLRTSPEFAMKRLLAAGYPDIFSICRVFRDGEAGQRHQPEFTIIEWYRLGMELRDIIEDSVRVISAALGDGAPAAAPRVIDYRDALAETCGVDLFDADVAALASAADADEELQRALGDARDDWLDLLLATRIVPDFPGDRLTVLRHYPSSQAALARRCPDDVRVADRFEVFLGDVELANGYVELTDATEQAARIAADNAERERKDRPLRPVDQHFLEALGHGLPACAGVALGLERLQMVHDNADDIGDVITFSFDA